MSEPVISNIQKILVVDDEPVIGRLLALSLEAEGYSPIVCTSSQDALIISKQEPFCLAFVDINLPDLNGLELAACLKNDDSSREVVFITGYGSLDNAVQAIKVGAYDYLKKPILKSELNLCLKRFQEKQALKEKIRGVEQRYFQLVQNIPLLIYVLNRDFKLEFVNEACSTMFGYVPSEAMNRPEWFVERIYSEDREKAVKMLESVFDTGAPASVECRFLHQDTHLIHAIFKAIPLFNSGTRKANEYLEGFVLDITDRVFLEKALIQREKLKTLGAISAEVAHEIRNPLMSIGGFAQRLKQKYPDLQECNIILKECGRLEKILSRIRHYLEPVEINPRECSVHHIIHECLNLLSPETEKKQVICKLDLPLKLPMVYADPEILTQIFINLLRNATSAIMSGGTLNIKGFESSKDFRIEFSNPIPDMKARQFESLFMPFADGGQSIGLPLCYRLVKDMGGLLSFAQEKNHITFAVSLPKL